MTQHIMDGQGLHSSVEVWNPNIYIYIYMEPKEKICYKETLSNTMFSDIVILPMDSTTDQLHGLLAFF